MNVNVINKISLIFNYLATSDIFSPKKLSFSTPAPQAMLGQFAMKLDESLAVTCITCLSVLERSGPAQVG